MISTQHFNDYQKKIGCTDAALASELGISERQVKRYKSGESAIPFSVMFQIVSLADEPYVKGYLNTKIKAAGK